MGDVRDDMICAPVEALLRSVRMPPKASRVGKCRSATSISIRSAVPLEDDAVSQLQKVSISTARGLSRKRESKGSRGKQPFRRLAPWRLECCGALAGSLCCGLDCSTSVAHRHRVSSGS